MTLMRSAIPPITPEFFKELQRAFTPTEVRPGTSHDTIMFEAGASSVVEWCRLRVRNAELMAAEQPIVKPND